MKPPGSSTVPGMRYTSSPLCHKLWPDCGCCSDGASTPNASGCYWYSRRCWGPLTEEHGVYVDQVDVATVVVDAVAVDGNGQWSMLQQHCWLNVL